MKTCNCLQAKTDGHDYSCRNHPRFKRARITDKMRLDYILKIGFIITTFSPPNKAYAEEREINRRSDIDAAIRAKYRMRGKKP